MGWDRFVLMSGQNIAKARAFLVSLGRVTHELGLFFGTLLSVLSFLSTLGVAELLLTILAASLTSFSNRLASLARQSRSVSFHAMPTGCGSPALLEFGLGMSVALAGLDSMEVVERARVNFGRPNLVQIRCTIFCLVV
jgi:hypothetical protein